MIAVDSTSRFIKIDLNSTSGTTTDGLNFYHCVKCGKVLSVYISGCKKYVEECGCNKTIIISDTRHDLNPDPPQIKNTFFEDMNKKFRQRQSRKRK